MDGSPTNNTPKNITLVCDPHHKEATLKLLTTEQIASADANPYNRQHGVSSPYGLHFEGDNFTCAIGGNKFSSRLRDEEKSTVAVAISVDNTDLVWFRIDPSGGLFLNASIFDENNLPLLVIRDNALVYRPATWDIEFKGRTLTLREAARRILLKAEFRPPTEVAIEQARLLCNGVEIIVRKTHLFVVNSETLLIRCKSDQCDIGLQLGRNDRPLAAGFYVPPEALSRYLMPEAEVKRREQAAVERMNELLANVANLDPPP